MYKGAAPGAVPLPPVDLVIMQPHAVHQGLSQGLVKQLRSVAETLGSLELSHPTRVGIDGFCAAGKTSVSAALAAILSDSGVHTIQVSTDDFQNPPEIRWQLGADSPEGFYRHAVDFEALKRELLKPLGPDGSRLYRTSTYDIRALRPNLSEQREASSASVLLLDGLFLHSNSLRGYFDFTIFVQAPFEACIRRARERNQEGRVDADQVETLYRQRYVPGFELYLNEERPTELASATLLNP